MTDDLDLAVKQIVERQAIRRILRKRVEEVQALGEWEVFITPEEFSNLRAATILDDSPTGSSMALNNVGGGAIGSLFGINVVVDTTQASGQLKRIEKAMAAVAYQAREATVGIRVLFEHEYQAASSLRGWPDNMELRGLMSEVHEGQMPGDEQILKSLSLMGQILEMTRD